jgi:hypothetical protein
MVIRVVAFATFLYPQCPRNIHETSWGEVPRFSLRDFFEHPCP